MVDFIITDFESVRGGGNIVDTVPSAEDFIVDNCTISSVVSGEFVLTPGESLVANVWLTANKTSITVGESVVFSAFVEDTDGEPLEDLTVSFYRDGISLGSGVSDDSGLAQLTVSSWSVGSFTCTASCQGVSSSGVTVTVADVPPTPTVSSVSLTSDKSVLSAYDSESATLTATVLDSSSNPMSGETVTFYNGSTSMGTATTNSSGIATKSYSSTGAGDVTFKATCESIDSSTITVEDCIFYHPTAISYTGTSTSDTVYSLGYDQIADLSSTNFEFTWTFRQTSYGGDVCLGASSEFSVSPVKSNYRVYIGGSGAGKTRHGYRTTSTTNTEGSTSDAVSLNTDHNMKIVRNGNTFTYYFNGNQLGTKTATFFGNYSMFGIHTVQWNKGTTTISNIKIKKVT